MEEKLKQLIDKTLEFISELLNEIAIILEENKQISLEKSENINQ